MDGYITDWLAKSHSTAKVPWLVFISHPAEGRRLSWPDRQVTYQDGVSPNAHQSQY